MKRGIYYVKELNCLCVIYNTNKNEFGRETIKFSAATYLNDVFTTIQHYKCNAEMFRRTFKPIRLTPKNYERYLTTGNSLKSTRVKKDTQSKEYEFSTKFGLKVIDRLEEVNKVRPFYDFLESKNFGKKRVLIVITTFEL